MQSFFIAAFVTFCLFGLSSEQGGPFGVGLAGLGPLGGMGLGGPFGYGLAGLGTSFGLGGPFGFGLNGVGGPGLFGFGLSSGMGGSGWGQPAVPVQQNGWGQQPVQPVVQQGWGAPAVPTPPPLPVQTGWGKK